MLCFTNFYETKLMKVVTTLNSKYEVLKYTPAPALLSACTLKLYDVAGVSPRTS